MPVKGKPSAKRVAVPASFDYTACTMNTQYTIRAVPPAIDRAIADFERVDEEAWK